VLRPAGPDRFARPPATPIEFWDAADYLVRSGQAKLAAPYLDAFLKSNPNDATLLDVRERFGVGSVLRLSNDPSTEPYAQPVLDLMLAAVRRTAADPKRLEQAIALVLNDGDERQIGIERLREAGPQAVSALLLRLSDPNLDGKQRSLFTECLGRMRSDAVPVLIAALDSPDEVQSAAAAFALGRIGDRRAVPALLFPAVRTDAPAALHGAAQRALATLGGATLDATKSSAATALAQQAWRYHRHQVAFPSDRVELWNWRDAAPVGRNYERLDAESELGLTRARQALQLEPSLGAAQVAYLSLALERAARLHGAAKVASDDPDGSFAEALATGPDVLGTVLKTAIADGHMLLAEVATAALGRVADRDALGSIGKASPIVEALSAPDRRVQLAAARALIELDPRRPFPGSSRLVPVLARFLNSHNGPRAVVIDGNTPRASSTAAVLRELGFDVETTGKGRDGFKFAAGSGGVELVLVEPSTLQGGWTWTDVVTNLRADPRTSDIPVFVTGTLMEADRLQARVERYPRTWVTVTPTDANMFKRVLDGTFARTGARPISQQEREGFSKEASELAARIAGQPGSPFAAELSSIGPALAVSLSNPQSSLAATAALGDVAGADAQRSLADRLLDPSQTPADRAEAGKQLVRSIQRFGPLLTNGQERRLVDTVRENADTPLRSILAAVIGALRPEAEVSGRRLGQAPAAVSEPATESADDSTAGPRL
jgi:HEAT repeat protein